MAKKKAKASPATWPMQYLVLWRSTLDDIPLLLTPDRKTATTYAKNVPQRDINAALDVMGLDHCSDVNITIVTFRKGRPFKMKVAVQLS